MTKAFPKGPLTRLSGDSSNLFHGHTAAGCVDIMHFIGVISTDWNFCEARLDALLVAFLGPSLGYQIAGQLGNQTKSDIVVFAVRKFEKNLKARQITEFSVKAFNKLREIRNSIIHSHYIYSSNLGRSINFIRKSASGNIVDFSLSRKKIVEIATAIQNLRSLLLDLSMFYSSRSHRRRALPKIFTLPDIRIRPRPATPKGRKRLAKSSSPKARLKRQTLEPHDEIGGES